MQQQLTVEQVQQERSRLESAIDNLSRRQSAAKNLAGVLTEGSLTIAHVKGAFASYYMAEALALEQDVLTLREQMQHLRQLEEQVRIASSGLVVGRWNKGEQR